MRDLIPKLGRNYSAYTEFLPERSYNQIKSQYHNYLNRRLIETNATPQDASMTKTKQEIVYNAEVHKFERQTERIQPEVKHIQLNCFLPSLPDLKIFTVSTKSEDADKAQRWKSNEPKILSLEEQEQEAYERIFEGFESLW